MKINYFFIWILFLTCCSSPDGTSEVKNQSLTLVYLSSRGDGFDLYKRKVGDSIDTKITSNPGWDWNPQPIEGGLIIQNSTDTSGGFTMRKIDLSGNELTFDLQGIPEVIIAPDGDQILFQRKTGDTTNLWLSKLSKIEDSIQITFKGLYNGRAKWSSQSDKIAYLSDRTGSNEIFIYHIGTQETTQLTFNKLREKYISWGPEGGSLITTMQTDSTENDIYRINIESKEVSQITVTPDVNESEIAWSPDGLYIAYHAKIDTYDDIFLLNLASKEVTKVTNGEGYHGEPIFAL